MSIQTQISQNCKPNCNKLFCGGYDGCSDICNIKRLDKDNKLILKTSSTDLIWKVNGSNFSYKYFIDMSPNQTSTLLSTLSNKVLIFKPIDGGPELQVEINNDGNILIIKNGGSIIQSDTILFLDNNTNIFETLNNSITILPINCEDKCLTFINDDNNCGFCNNKCPNNTKCCGRKCIPITENDTCSEHDCNKVCGNNEINCGGICLSRDRVYDDCSCSGNWSGNECEICLPNFDSTCTKCLDSYFGDKCQFSNDKTCYSHGKVDENGNCKCFDNWSTYITISIVDQSKENSPLYMSKIPAPYDENVPMRYNGRIGLSLTPKKWIFTSDGQILDPTPGPLTGKMDALTVYETGVEKNVYLTESPGSSWTIENNNIILKNKTTFINNNDTAKYILIPLSQTLVDGRPIIINPSNYDKWVIEKEQCNVSPAGTYSDGILPYRLECPGGSYCPQGLGAVKPIPCPAGSYCPQGSSEPKNCEAGDYCPPNSQYKRSCPAGYYCQVPETKQICPQGYYNITTGKVDCLQCPSGSYCPDTTSSPIPCPNGIISCPAGSIAPKKCPNGQSYQLLPEWLGGTILPPSCLPCPENTLCVGGVENECPNSYCPPGSIYNNNKGVPYPAYYADYGNVQTPYLIGCQSDTQPEIFQSFQLFDLVIFISPKYDIINKNATAGFLVNNKTWSNLADGSDIPTDENNVNWFIDKKIFKDGIKVIKMRESGYGPDITLTLRDRTKGTQFSVRIQQNQSGAIAYTPSEMTIYYNGVAYPSIKPSSANPIKELYLADKGFVEYPSIVSVNFQGAPFLKISAKVTNPGLVVDPVLAPLMNLCDRASKVWIS